MTAKRKPDAELTDHERAIWAKFDVEIEKGLASAKAGDVVDAEQFFEQLIEELRARKKPKG